MGKQITLIEIIELTKQLSILDKLRLIEEIAPQIEQELRATQPAQRTPIAGLWKDVNITEDDIAEARADLWGGFPRKDI